MNSEGTLIAISAPYYNSNTGIVYIYEYDGTNWNLSTSISGNSTNDLFGQSITLSNNILAIGSPGYNSNTGLVSVYQNSSGSWTQLGSSIIGQTTGDNLGFSVSLRSDGSILGIGSTGSLSGYTSVYNWDGSTWTQLGEDIDGINSDEESGYSISLINDGSVIAIGTNSNNISMYSYKVPNSYDINYRTIIQGNDSSLIDNKYYWVNIFTNELGKNVNIVNNILAIGNPSSNSNSGEVSIYEYNTNVWNQLGSDIDGEYSNDQSGFSVSLSSNGSIVAIGALNNDGNGSNSGHVRVYQWDGSSNWNQLGSDIDGEYSDDRSGVSVSLSSDGSIVAIGAYKNDGNGSNSGHVRVYQWDESSTWNQLGSDIDGEYSNDQSGFSVSLSSNGSIVAIGALNNDGNGNNSGHVRVYQWDGSSTWNQLGSDIDGESAGDRSGRSVSLSSDGTILAIGAWWNDGNGTNAGQVRVYEWDGSSTWNQLGSDIDGEYSYDQSGTSVSLSSQGSIVAIGANSNDGNGSNSGHVRVYGLNGIEPTTSSNGVEASLPAAGVCMTGETLIETDQDLIQVKDLDVNFHTIRTKQINAITKIKLHKFENNLIKICKDALGVNKPFKDLYLTNDHKIMYNNRMIRAKRLYNKNIEGIEKVDYKNEILYNIVMEKHSWINTQNVVIETLNPEHKIAKYYLRKNQKMNI